MIWINEHERYRKPQDASNEALQRIALHYLNQGEFVGPSVLPLVTLWTPPGFEREPKWIKFRAEPWKRKEEP